MILNDFTEPKLKFSRDKLDTLLAELCGLVITHRKENPDFNGWVGAAVIDPQGQLATGTSYYYGNQWVHAERNAIDKYEQEYGELPKGSIVVTTLSPCSDRMDDRYSKSCTDLLNSRHVKMAYCGYSDPSQENKQDKFATIITDNSKLKELCKQLADTFLKDDLKEESSKQILSYVKKIHPKGEFTIDQSITNHPEWELTNVPLSKLHIESSEVSPYDQINHINYAHVANITAQDIKAKPIVVDSEGWIIDGNHRAVAARDMGMKSIPAYVPVESEEDDEQETYAQHMARIKKERELSEVVINPNVKTKSASNTNLVNKGQPIPPGKEAKLLGTRVGKLGAYEVYKYDQGNDSAYSVFDTNTRVSQLTVSGHNKAHSFEIFGVYAGPEAPVKAADLYAWLVRNQGLTLLSDKQQSPGGHRVWQDLEQRYGRSVNVYAYNMRTNEPINTGADDPESTHGHRGDIAQNVRLVAAPK